MNTTIDIIQVADRFKAFKQDFILDVTSWEGYPNSVNLNWNIVKFEKGNKDYIPDSPGIYAFFIKPGIANLPENAYLMYIGKAGDRSNNTLKKRFIQYTYETKRPKLYELFTKWKNYVYFCYAEITDPTSNLGDIEIELNDALNPPCNENDFSVDIRSARKVLR